jgi:hypothetical protein
VNERSNLGELGGLSPGTRLVLVVAESLSIGGISRRQALDAAAIGPAELADVEAVLDSLEQVGPGGLTLHLPEQFKIVGTPELEGAREAAARRVADVIGVGG